MKNKLIISVILLMLSVKIGNAQQQHEYVDLGLPSGTLWATCNVGADNPWEYGDYFAWGETSTKNNYGWSTYKYANDNYDKLTKYCHKSKFGFNGYTDSLKIIEQSDDVAYQMWGSNWCIPTASLYEELEKECVWSWTSHNGKSGYEVKGPNGKSIFLPAAGYQFETNLDRIDRCGYYLSSSLIGFDPSGCQVLMFNSGIMNVVGWCDRAYGWSVRPVYRGN